MISIFEALKIIEREIFSLEAETIDLENAVNRVLAEPIKADMDLPPFDRSQMDGFAVRTRDVEATPIDLKIVGEAAAGKGFDEKVKRGEAVRIMTGARVPKDTDAVQKVELTEESGGFIRILEPTKLKQHIVTQGEEIRQGTKIFSKGELITERKIAVPASFGYAKVKVFKTPEVFVLATGSEIVNISEKPAKDQIRNSNSLMLKTLAKECGANVQILPSVKDDIEILKSQIAEAVGLNSKIKKIKPQILIITGGVSVGDYDYTKSVLRDLGAEIFFERIALRPGKPTVFAKLNDTFVFGLPGNPVSSAVTFYLFVRKTILQMQSANDYKLNEGFAVLSSKAKGAKGRDSFLPAKTSIDEAATLRVKPLRWSGSSDFVAFSKADCLIFVPQNKSYERDDIVKIIYLP